MDDRTDRPTLGIRERRKGRDLVRLAGFVVVAAVYIHSMVIGIVMFSGSEMQFKKKN